MNLGRPWGFLGNNFFSRKTAPHWPLASSNLFFNPLLGFSLHFAKDSERLSSRSSHVYLGVFIAIAMLERVGGGPPADRYKCGYGAPINGRKQMGNWGNNPAYRSITPFITGKGPTLSHF